MTKVDRLIVWGREAYRALHKREKNVNALLAIHATTYPAVRRLLKQIKETTSLGQNLHLTKWEMLPKSPILPISCITPIIKGKRSWAELDFTEGAYAFHFDSPDGKFTVIYLAWEHGHDRKQRAIALLPFGRLQEWHRFQEALYGLATVIKPSRKKAYIVGSNYEHDFKPTATLADVILPGDLKNEIVTSIDGFFNSGVKAYSELGVPAFRKYLLYGAPGNGKSLLCQAIAADQIAKKRVVVFVSASDNFGADFNKIQSALTIARRNKFPVLIIVEEIDSYVTNPAMRAQVLDLLDGFEAPANSAGSVLVMTTNHPEVLDESILRFGRVDQRWEIPNIQTAEEARLLLQRYLGCLYEPDDHALVATDMIGLPRVFARELAFASRMRAAQSGETHLNGHLRATFKAMKSQATKGEEFLRHSSGWQFKPQVPN
jgi:hypothetical protein